MAQYRATTVAISADPVLVDFVAQLEARSPMFAALWRRQEVARPPACQKTLDHPRAGRLTLDYATLRPDGGADDLRFTVYTPADSQSAGGRDLLIDARGSSWLARDAAGRSALRSAIMFRTEPGRSPRSASIHRSSFAGR